MSLLVSHKKLLQSQALLFLLLALSFLLTYSQVLLRLAQVWSNSDDYSHGFLVIPISLFVIWQKRNLLKKLPLQPSWLGLPVVLLSLMCYLIGKLGGVLTLESLSLVMSLSGAILFLFGIEALKVLSFPVFFLLLMIPIPSQIYASLTVPLQLLVSMISTKLVQLFNIPIYREGNVLHIADRTLEVVQACSGLRSMISLFTLSLVFGYFTLRSNVLRAVLFASSVPIAVVVNIIRVACMALAFHYYEYDLTEGTTHTSFGVAIFFISLTLVFLLQRILAHWESTSTPASSS